MRTALEAQDNLAAHRAARAWVEAEPTSARARLSLAATYAEVDAPAASIEHIRAGLRLSPDAETTRALHQLAAAAFGRIGETDAAWVARLATVPSIASLNADDRAALIDTYEAMISRHAWITTLERVAREAEAGSPAATVRLAALTQLSGDLALALSIAERGRERFPDDRALRDEWLRLLALDLRERFRDISAERAAALHPLLNAAETAGADEFHLGHVRRQLNDAGWTGTGADPRPELQISLAAITAEVAHFERDARATLSPARTREETAGRQLTALANLLAAQGVKPAPVAWWRTQLDTLTTADREHRRAKTVFDNLTGSVNQLDQAIAGLGENDAVAGEALSARIAAALVTTAPRSATGESGEAATGYDIYNALVLEQQIRTGLAAARLRESLADKNLKPAEQLAATDLALAFGVMSPEAWITRARAAKATGSLAETGFAAARALQESRRNPAVISPAALTELNALVTDNIQTAQDAAAEAWQLLAKGEWEPALAAADRALRHDPMRPEAWRVRLAIGQRIGDEAMALEALRRLWLAAAEEGLDWREALNLACRAGDWPLVFSLAETAREADLTLVDSWYFYGLAARALGHDQLTPEIDAVLRPSTRALQSQWADRMAQQGPKLEAHFYLWKEFSDALGRADEPAGLRLWIAWMEGGRGSLGKADHALRARLLNGSPDDAHVKRLLGQTSASDYAKSEAALASPATAAWVEGVLALSRSDAVMARGHLERAMADPALPVDLRAMAARWTDSGKTWRPVRAFDVFHLSAALVKAGASANEAAPGQLVALSTTLTADRYTADGSRRIRGVTGDAKLVVARTVTLRRGDGMNGTTPVLRPRVWEWDELTVAKPEKSTENSTIGITGLSQLTLQRVDVLAGIDVNVSGVLDAHEGTGSCHRLNVGAGGLCLVNDAAWSVGGGTLAGRAEWRGGHLSFYVNAPAVQKNGVLSLTDMTVNWYAFPIIQDGGAMSWKRVTGYGNLADAGAVPRWTTEASVLAGALPAGMTTPAGLTHLGLPRENAPSQIKVATTEELEAAVKKARAGDVIQLTNGTYEPKAVLELPAGVSLIGSYSKIIPPPFGQEPVLRFKGPGAVRIKQVQLIRDPPKGSYPASWKKRSLLEVSDGAVVLVEGGALDWNTHDKEVPTVLLRGGSRVFVDGQTYLRGSATLTDTSGLTLMSFITDNFNVTGGGRLLVGVNYQGRGLTASGANLRVDGAIRKGMLAQGAGGARDHARQQLLRVARDTTWQRAAETFRRDYAAAASRPQRVDAAAAFTRTVRKANLGAAAAASEAGEFAWLHLKPVYKARPDEAPYIDLVTYPIYGTRHRPAADVGPAVVAARAAFRGARQVSKANEDTAEFDRALILTRAYPPGSLDYALVESAFQRGLTPAQLAQEVRERAAKAAELAAARERVRLAAEAENNRRRAALIAQMQQRNSAPAPAAPARYYSSGYSGGTSSYTPPPSPPQWTPSQSYRNDMYRRELEVTIRKNVYGR